MSEYAIVMSTTDSLEEAKTLSRQSVERRLAACVQMTEVTSTFHWDGEVQEAPEFLLLFKTSADRVGDLREYLSATHSYDTPEILEVPISGGGRSYLEWIVSSTR